VRILDHLFARAVHGDFLFFTKGWGDPAVLDLIGDPGAWRTPPRIPEVEWTEESVRTRGPLPPGWAARRGRFASPFPGELLPEESRTGWIELIGPPRGGVPAVIHFASTGDQGFGRRRGWMAEPLARAGIASLILENPYYGRRRPAAQPGYRLLHVSDLLSMGAATVLEGAALAALLRERGFGPVGVSGVSMGGSMAAMAGALGSAVLGSHVPVAACLAAHSPEAVFVDGLLSRYCDWRVLKEGADDPRAKFRQWVAPCDIRRFPRPSDPGRVILLGARRDAYVPPESVKVLHDSWPGASLEWLPGGHVSTVLFRLGRLREAVVRSVRRP
jgi:hypothetical protein